MATKESALVPLSAPADTPKRGIHLVRWPKPADRRRHVRIATDEAAVMRVLDPFSGVSWLVRVMNLSESGMRLISPTPLLPGNLVQISVKNASVLAVVRHCVEQAGEAAESYQVGIEVRHIF